MPLLIDEMLYMSAYIFQVFAILNPTSIAFPNLRDIFLCYQVRYDVSMQLQFLTSSVHPRDVLKPRITFMDFEFRILNAHP